jgi:hypothetical protein
VTSRKRPGETPIGLVAERVGELFRRTSNAGRDAKAAA